MDYDNEAAGGGISDQLTPDGVFQNMQYAYTFRDTLVYGEILHPEFLFTYRDYDTGFDVTWSREEEMKTTFGLFENTERLDLIWNNIVLSTVDSTQANIIRGFNLTVTFNPTDVVRIDGRVNLLMRRSEEDNKWRIIQWIDESNF